MRVFCKYLMAGSAMAILIGVPAWSVQDEISVDTTAGLGETDSGIAVYASIYFASFSPVTALDMVQRVPGFSLSNGDTSRRGLGDSFGNVLINGTRPANKALTLETVLQRIRVEDVQQLELIQEALPQYDMRGHSRLINIVMRDGAGNSGSFNLRAELPDSNRLGPRGEASYTTSVGNVEITAGMYAHIYGRRVRRNFVRTYANDDPFEFQQDNAQRRWTLLRPSLSLNWQIDAQSSLRIDGQAQLWDWKNEQHSRIDEPFEGRLRPLRFEPHNAHNDGDIYDASMTYQRDLDNGVSLQTIGLVGRLDEYYGPERYETFDPVTGFVEATIVDNQRKDEETAIRQTISFEAGPAHSVEFGAEMALNARDTTLNIRIDDGTAITPLALPVANTRVEETRSEVFATHVWTINSALSLESGLRWEFSEITQTGDADQSRSFSYAKPSVTLNWRQSDQNRVRVTARRDVAQLQFDKYASSVDIADGNATLGNPNYVPERSMTLEAEWERRFGDDGSFSLQVAQDWFQDKDGWVPISTPTGVFDAPGNIGDGTNFRVTANLTTPLNGLGLSNAVFDVFAEWYNTNIEDPLTGNDRPFDGFREWELALDYRQTFPEAQISWGWNYHWVSNGEFFRAAEYRLIDDTDGDLDLYVETSRWGGVTTRLGVDALFGAGGDRERVFFDGSRSNAIVSSIEHRNIDTGPTWYLQVRGTF
jgi:hypothetical protein